MKKSICLILGAIIVLANFTIASTVAYWKFDEGTGQVISNSQGSGTMTLSMGNSASIATPYDYYEPVWDIGFFGSALRGKPHSQNIPFDQPEDDGAGTYAKNTSQWTSSDITAVFPTGSYSFELLFNVDEYPADPNWTHDNPLGVLGCWDKETIVEEPGYFMRNRYVIRTYERLVGSEWHKVVEYFVRHDEDNTTTIRVDVAANGMDIVPGRWYYLGVMYNNSTQILELVIRDMHTGQIASAQTSAQPVYGLTAGHDPFFLICSEGVDGRNLDGLIDEVRFSNHAVTENERLYNNYQSPQTAAYWRFDEGNGQEAFNLVGSTTSKLQFGNSAGSDIYDPQWAAGLVGSAMQTKMYSENNNAAVYCKNASTWTSDDAIALTPLDSYSVEVIFNADSYPNYAGWDSDNPMGIMAYKDNTTGKFQYLLRTYKKDYSGQLHKVMHFYSQHADGTNGTIIFDVEAAGLDIVPGKWYYVAAIYDDFSQTMELSVRDIETGQNASTVAAMKPMSPMAATPNPLMTVGSEGTSGRCFDGRIDEVRITSGIVLDRLFDKQVGDWGYLRGDINKDGQVGLADFALLAAGWMQCSNSNDILNCIDLN